MDHRQREYLDNFVCEVLRLPKDDQYTLPSMYPEREATVLRIYVELGIEKKAA